MKNMRAKNIIVAVFCFVSLHLFLQFCASSGPSIIPVSKTAPLNILEPIGESNTGVYSERDLPPRPVLDPKLVEDYVIYYTNIQRVANGLPILRRDRALSRAAEIHSVWMAERRRLTHSEDRLYSPASRVEAACGEEKQEGCMDRFQYRPPGYGSYLVCCSENAIQTFDLNMDGVSFYSKSDEKGDYREYTRTVRWRSEKEVAYRMVLDWMHSPGHRQNILDPGNTALGFGSAYDGGEFYYGTQVFAPHTARGIPSGDFLIRQSGDDKDFILGFQPKDPLVGYGFRLVDDAGEILSWQYKKGEYHFRPEGGRIPRVVRIEVEDNRYPGFFHPLCQVRIYREGEKIAWKWADWDVM